MKTIKRQLLFVAFLLCWTSLFAQSKYSVGFQIGSARERIGFPNSKWVSGKSNPEHSLLIGASIHRQLNERLSLRTGLNARWAKSDISFDFSFVKQVRRFFTFPRYTIERYDVFTSVHYDYVYVQLPVLLDMTISRFFPLKVVAGLDAKWLAYSQNKINQTILLFEDAKIGGFSINEGIDHRVKKFRMAVIIGMGFRFQLWHNGPFVEPEIRYEYDVNNLASSQQFQSVAFNLSIHMPI